MFSSLGRRTLLLLGLLLAASVAAVWWLRRDDAALHAPATTAASAGRDRACPHAEELARRFAPALALAPDDQAPRTVELFLDRATLVYGDGDRRAEETGVAPARLARLADHPEAFLRLPPAVDDPAGQRRLYEQAIASDRAERYAVTTYAGVYCDANSAGLDGHTIIQYWLFYLYNDFHNKHEGDWELIQVVLGPDGRPRFAAYAQHNTYTWRDWSEVLVETRAGEHESQPGEEHPRVYVARGSHASYFQYAAGGYGLDRVVDAREFVIPRVQLLPMNEGAEPATFGWLRFPGAWGEVPSGQPCAGCQRGPVGPAFNAGGAKWRTPLTWGGRRLLRDDLIAHRTARIVVRTRGLVHFYDAQNRHTGPLADGRFERAAPGVAHLTRPGSDQQILLAPDMDAATPARVEIEGADLSGLDVLLPDSTGALRLHFGRVELAPAGRVRLVLGPAGPALRVDAKGDGRFDRTVAPQTIEQIPTPLETR